MKFLRVRSYAVVSALLIAGAAGVTGSGANAALSDCTTTTATCLWGSDNYVFLTIMKNSNTGGVALTGDANDTMDSWQNRSNTRNSRGRANSNGSGDCQTFSAGSKDPNVAFFNSDEVSWLSTTAGC